MRKEITKKMKYVILHLGAKKHEIKTMLDESEDLPSCFIEAGELPEEPKASPEIQARFNNYMSLEMQVDAWFDQKMAQIYGLPNLSIEILEVIHQDTINFINKIDEI